MARRKAGSQIANFDSRPEKGGNRLDLLGYKGCAIYLGKLSMKATTLLETTSRSEVCSQSYGVSKLRESQLARFRDSHSGVPGEKSHLDVSSMASHKVYYKGEGGGFPQVWAMVSLMCLCCPLFVLAPKVLQLCTNHFVWIVCKPV